MSFINKEEFRQALIDRQITTQFFNPRERHEIGCVIEMLDNTPTADVVEVRHGEWLVPLTDEPWQTGCFCRCSVCKYINRGHTLNVPNFCENCGAKMDGERSTDNE